MEIPVPSLELPSTRARRARRPEGKTIRPRTKRIDSGQRERQRIGHCAPRINRRAALRLFDAHRASTTRHHFEAIAEAARHFPEYVLPERTEQEHLLLGADPGAAAARSVANLSYRTASGRGSSPRTHSRGRILTRTARVRSGNDDETLEMCVVRWPGTSAELRRALPARSRGGRRDELISEVASRLDNDTSADMRAGVLVARCRGRGQRVHLRVVAKHRLPSPGESLHALHRGGAPVGDPRTCRADTPTTTAVGDDERDLATATPSLSSALLIDYLLAAGLPFSAINEPPVTLSLPEGRRRSILRPTACSVGAA